MFHDDVVQIGVAACRFQCPDCCYFLPDFLISIFYFNDNHLEQPATSLANAEVIQRKT